MKMGGYERVDAQPQLRAVGDGAAYGNFGNGADWASEDGKGDLVVGEGTDKCAVCKLRGHIDVDVVGEGQGGSQVPGSVFWSWRSQERKIPAIFEEGQDLGCIEISLQGETPGRDWKGQPRERDPEGIHIGRITR